MNAWDGWAGSLLGSLVGSAAGLGIALLVMFRTRRSDRDGQNELLRKQEALSRRNAASDELAQLCRAVASLVTLGNKRGQQLEIELTKALALASAFRIGLLLGPEGDTYGAQLVDSIDVLGNKARQLTGLTIMERAGGLPAEVDEFAATLFANATLWLEAPDRRAEAMEKLKALTRT